MHGWHRDPHGAVIILALGLLLSRFEPALPAAVGVITLLSCITVIQRLLYVYGRRDRE